jgi:hypothetical protein
VEAGRNHLRREGVACFPLDGNIGMSLDVEVSHTTEGGQQFENLHSACLSNTIMEVKS